MISWAINKQPGGLAPYQLWPNPDSFTWASFYQDLPQSVTDFILPALISLTPPDLSKSPNLIRLVYPNGAAHFVMGLNIANDYYDSEPGGAIKKMGARGEKITSISGISVTDNFFLKSAGFTPAQFANLSMSVQLAIKANDAGGKNIIMGDKILVQE